MKRPSQLPPTKGLDHVQIGAKLSLLGNGAAISYWNGSFDINLLEPGLTNSSRCILSSGNRIDAALFERAKVRLAERKAWKPPSKDLFTYLATLDWRDRHDRIIPIGKMTTLHLYHTIKMIWNNEISPARPYGEVIRWEFSWFTHPKSYLRDFYKVGLAALKLRRNRKVAQGFLDHISMRPQP